MYKFFSNLSLRNLILIVILFFSIVIFSFTILYLSLRVSSNTKEDSKTIVDHYTGRYALKIEGLLNQAMCVTRTLADVLSGNPDSSLTDINRISGSILKNTLSKNPDFLQVWFDWEIKLIKPDFYRNFGRVGTVVFKDSNGKFQFNRHLKDTFDIEPENDYTISKKTGKEMVGEPYYDKMSKTFANLLMVSPTVPMKIDDKFAGWVGIDMDMSHIQSIIKDIKPYERTIAYLISPGKNIIAQNDEKFQNQSLIEVNQQYKVQFSEALQEIDKGNKFSFIYQNENDEEVYVSMFPLVIGRDNEIWGLATETPLNEILAKSRSMFVFTLFIGLIGLVLLSVIIYFLLDSIIKRLNLSIKHSEKISQGDLSSRLDIVGKNEIALLGISLNKMADKLKNIVLNIRSASETINLTSKNINSYSVEIAESASSQASSVEEVMASIEEMTANIQNSSNNSKETEIIAEKAVKGINSGSISARKTVKSIKKIAENISIIREISHQTNILSLNAAVEAARAGVHGKGFAVVANEVKKLAEKAQIAAKQITSLAAEGVNISDLADKELNELLPDIGKTAQLIREIANASAEQSNGAIQIQNVIQELNDIAQKNALHSEQLSIKAADLLKQSSQLEEMIGFFNI